MKSVTSCTLCGSSSLRALWSLPSLPLTECFGSYLANHDLAHDQVLLICGECGHVQLQNQLPAQMLYTHHDYSFRTSESKTAQQGSESFLDFLGQVASPRSFRCMVDIGGNDLYLAHRIGNRSRERWVIDPICQPDDGRVIDGVHVVGQMVEKVDLSRDLGGPDLVLCRHTLEHIAEPRALLRQLFAQCAEDCLYVFEIPCFESLVEAQRFDAVFHQHYHYYDLFSLKRLLDLAGAEYLAHRHNWQGSCGGSLMIAFRAGVSDKRIPHADVGDRERYLRRRIARYEHQMEVMAQLLSELPQPIFGYGASLMLATLGYHLHTDFKTLECILDDDAGKNGWTYKNVPVTVRHTCAFPPPSQASYLVTSLENVRPISRRIASLTPRRILVPLLL